ncbi:MAG: ribulose-phosphate 3-epimerase [Clostridia bacterium]
MKIAPSVLAADITNLKIELERVSNSDYIHLDIMDGHFVPNLSYGPGFVAGLKKISNVPFDVHLMLSNPSKYIKSFAEAGADIISFHVESEDDIEKTIELINSFGIKPALALKPNTDIETVLPYLDKLFMVLIMTVEPGFGGQSFMPVPLEKIQKIREKSKDILIQADGGIGRANIEYCKEMGVDISVCGTSVFSAKDPKSEIEFLQKF